MGAYGDSLASMGTFGDPLAPMGTYGGLWAPMGAYGDLSGPVGTYGGLWGHFGTHWHLWGPMGTYGVGGINFLHTHFDNTPPPLPPSIRSILDISHILLYTLQNKHATSDIRHETLYKILPWPCQDSFLGPDFVPSANDSM